jgi:hypothetical protein
MRMRNERETTLESFLIRPSFWQGGRIRPRSHPAPEIAPDTCIAGFSKHENRFSLLAGARRGNSAAGQALTFISKSRC